MKKLRLKPGDVVAIPVGTGRAHGRKLQEVYFEFYDSFQAAAAEISVADVVTRPVLFRVAVSTGFGEKWQRVGNVPLSDREKERMFRFKKQDSISGSYAIYWRHPASKQFGDIPATAEECEGLETAAVWYPEHVEERLAQHVKGSTE